MVKPIGKPSMFASFETGEKNIPGLLFVCGACGGSSWQLFQLNHHDHFHIQCRHCKVAFCPQGPDCPPSPAAQAQAAAAVARKDGGS